MLDTAVSIAELDALHVAATRLCDEHLKLIRALVDARRNAGLSVEALAERLGCSAKKVAAFERYDSDPRLSFVRRYALAVGASIEHTVTAR